MKSRRAPPADSSASRSLTVAASKPAPRSSGCVTPIDCVVVMLVWRSVSSTPGLRTTLRPIAADTEAPVRSFQVELNAAFDELVSFMRSAWPDSVP